MKKTSLRTGVPATPKAAGPAKKTVDESPKAARRTQAQRRETTRGQLIDATIDCLYEGGFSGVTVAAVAKRAKLTTGAVQHYFPTRNDLIIEMVVAMREKVSQGMKAGELIGKALGERVEEICALYWKVFSDRHYIAAVQVQLGAMNDPDLSLQVSKAIQQVEKDLDRSWMAAFADIDCSPARVRAVRYVALAAIRGLAIRRTLRTRKPDWEQERSVLVEMVVKAFSDT